METETHIVKLFYRVRTALEEKGFTAGGNLTSIILEEHLRDDACWIATANCFEGDVDNAKNKKFEGVGLEAHEAILDLIEKIENS